MSNTNTNTPGNVSAGKPKITGAVFRAPAGTTPPTDSSTSLAEAFKALGYVSSDGVTNSNNVSTQTVRAWGGDVVDVPLSEKTDTFKLKLIEALNVDVLKTVFGDGNVTGSALASGISVSVNSADYPEGVWVIDQLLKGNTAKRIVIPKGKISELEDIVYKDSEVISYGLTISCLPDGDGNTHYEYIKTVSTT